MLEAAGSNLRLIIQFALETAMRRSEIASLTWDNIDLKIKRRFVHIPETKNDEARSVPLSRKAIVMLKSIARRIRGPVFGWKGPSVITKHFGRAVQEAGIEDLRSHDLRHEAISRLFEDTNLDVMEVKRISGHKTLQMLARYRHLRTHRLADRLDGAKR